MTKKKIKKGGAVSVGVLGRGRSLSLSVEIFPRSKKNSRAAAAKKRNQSDFPAAFFHYSAGASVACGVY